MIVLLLQVLVVVLIFCIVMWMINSLAPISPRGKIIVSGIAAIILILILCEMIGLFGGAPMYFGAPLRR